jgi:hypothetical protein
VDGHGERGKNVDREDQCEEAGTRNSAHARG